MTAVSGNASASRFLAYYRDCISRGIKVAGRHAYGSRDVGTSDTLDGRVEVIEGLALDNLSADLAANTERREATLDDDDAVIGRQKM